MRAALALLSLAVACAPRIPAVEDSPLFNGATGPLRGVSAPQGLSLSAASCAACHADRHSEWAASRHARSWDNPLFTASFAREPRQWCVSCHAPLPEQAAERSEQGLPADSRSRPVAGLLAEGINCAVCHLRGGVVLSARAPSEAGLTAHPMRQAAALRDSDFCASCHQFTFPGSTVAMQDTFAEWRAWGQGADCRSCHLAAGAHDFAGAHDEQKVREAVGITAVRAGERVRVGLMLSGVGHRFPSGDPFRRLVFQLCAGEPLPVGEGSGGCEVVAERTFLRGFAADGGQLMREDTLAPPGVTFELTGPGATSYRLEYRYAAPATEGDLAPWEAAFQIASGPIAGH